MSKRKKIILYLLLGIILLGGIGFGTYYYSKANKIVSILTIDINPSIKVSLNYKNKVIKMEGLNKEGKELLENNKFKGNTLEKTIKIISKKVIEKEYIKKMIIIF